MKKQFINVMMTLAIVFGLSVSAMAQNDGWTIENAVWHLPGSSHDLTVAGNSNSTYSWTVESVDCSGDPASNEIPILADATSATVTVTYTSSATGIYRFLAEETTDDGACTTVREFFTAIMNIDVVVIASDDAGAAETELRTCSDYTDFVSFTPATLVENTIDDLAAHTDAAWFNQRYVNVTLTVADNSGCTGDVANSPSASDFAWRFNYTIDDGTDDNFGDNFLGMQPVTGVTYNDNTSLADQISVAAGITSIIIPLRSYIRWGTDGTDADQQFIFTVDAGSTDLDLGGGTYTDGTEPDADPQNTNNSSDNQIIDASPATPRITVN